MKSILDGESTHGGGSFGASSLTRGILVLVGLVISLVAVTCAPAQQLPPGAAALDTDWPTYMHDSARSGTTTAAIDLPLEEQWVYTAPAAPQPAWTDPQAVTVDSFRELPKVKVDDAFHVAVAGDAIYFGSSVDNKIYSLEAATGKLRWTFFTGGPVRLAPTVYQGRVYAGSDDGYVYCLNAADGRLTWKFRGAPSARRVLGGGKMISLWPIRTGVLVDGDIACFGAGIFPAERVYMYGVSAKDGSLIWKNDTLSELNAGQADRAVGKTADFSPQGYLLASGRRVFAPSGRGVPACFDRENGRMLYQIVTGWPGKGRMGFTYALLTGDLMFAGSQNKLTTYKQETGESAFAWFPGRRMIVTPKVSYLLDGAGIRALDRIAYQQRKVKHKDLPKRPTNWDKSLIPPALADCIRWTCKRQGLDAMIAAGGFLLAGGENEVVAIDRATGKELWTAKVDGRTRGLAVAGGRLVVSTDRGNIYYFASGPPPAARAKKQVPNPYPADELTLLCERAAKEIVEQTGVKRGYCLVLDCGTGRLASELAKRTELMIYGIQPDENKVEQARRTLDAAGLYGTRVCVDQGEPGALPYSDYFADLIVSEEAVVRGKLPASAKEAFRVLKPCGGVLLMGQPAGVKKGSRQLSEETLSEWIATASAKETVESVHQAGTWVKLVRGPLERSGSWTHQYGDPGNTGSSEDQLVKAPFGVLWYGEPGPGKAAPRHARSVAPLSIGGRVFKQGVKLTKTIGKTYSPADGTELIICFDAYNGVMHWEREIPGACRIDMEHECGNLACTADSLFVAVGRKCLRLDAATGRTVAAYETEDGGNWAYVAVADGVLFGSEAAERQFSKTLFAVDIQTGKRRWTYRGTKIRNNTVAVSRGRVFFAESSATPAQRRQALKTKITELQSDPNVDDATVEKVLAKADVRVAVALDAATGSKAWQKPVDLTGCGGKVLSAICTDGVLLFCASMKNGHYTARFLEGAYGSVRAVALSTEDGALLWSKALGYSIRPLVLGGTIYAEPWAFDLLTGRQKMRTHPWTGKPTPWVIDFRDKHCGAYAGCAGALLFRSRSTAYYDLMRDHGTEHFPGVRPGCWINTIPACGLVIQPEASSGCVCPESVQCTVVLQPRGPRKTWGRFAARGEKTPVQHMAVNLGGPGDRRDDHGTLWLGYPRPSRGHSTVRFKHYFALEVTTFPGCGYFNRAAEHCPIAETDTPWLYSSGCSGPRRLIIPVIGKNEPATVFTVRLGFAEMQHGKPGARVFDIKIQDKLVEKGFDIVRAAGRPHKAVVRQFTGIEVADRLDIQLIPPAKEPSKAQVPVLNTVEILREGA